MLHYTNRNCIIVLLTRYLREYTASPRKVSTLCFEFSKKNALCMVIKQRFVFHIYYLYTTENCLSFYCLIMWEDNKGGQWEILSLVFIHMPENSHAVCKIPTLTDCLLGVFILFVFCFEGNLILNKNCSIFSSLKTCIRKISHDRNYVRSICRGQITIAYLFLSIMAEIQFIVRFIIMP
jgi:hypothetical protein